MIKSLSAKVSNTGLPVQKSPLEICGWSCFCRTELFGQVHKHLWLRRLSTGFERPVIYFSIWYKPDGDFGQPGWHCQIWTSHIARLIWQSCPISRWKWTKHTSLNKGLSLFLCLIRDVQAFLLVHDFEKCNFIALLSLPSLEENKIFCPIRSVGGKRLRRNLVVMGKLNRPESAVHWEGPERLHTCPELGNFP